MSIKTGIVAVLSLLVPSSIYATDLVPDKPIVGAERVKAFLEDVSEQPQFPLLDRPLPNISSDYYSKLIDHLFCLDRAKTDGATNVSNVKTDCGSCNEDEKKVLASIANVSKYDYHHSLFPNSLLPGESITFYTAHQAWQLATVMYKSIHSAKPDKLAEQVYEHVTKCTRNEYRLEGGHDAGKVKASFAKHLQALQGLIKSPADLLPVGFENFIDQSYMVNLGSILGKEITNDLLGKNIYADALGMQKLADLKEALNGSNCQSISKTAGELVGAFIPQLTLIRTNAFVGFMQIDALYVALRDQLNEAVDKCLSGKTAVPKDHGGGIAGGLSDPAPGGPLTPSETTPKGNPLDPEVAASPKASVGKPRILKIASLVSLFGGVILVLAAVAYYLLVDNDTFSVLE